MLKRKLAPVHPGEFLREDFLKEKEISISEFAVGLGINRNILSSLIN